MQNAYRCRFIHCDHLPSSKPERSQQLQWRACGVLGARWMHATSTCCFLNIQGVSLQIHGLQSPSRQQRSQRQQRRHRQAGKPQQGACQPDDLCWQAKHMPPQHVITSSLVHLTKTLWEDCDALLMQFQSTLIPQIPRSTPAWDTSRSSSNIVTTVCTADPVLMQPTAAKSHWSKLAPSRL